MIVDYTFKTGDTTTLTATAVDAAGVAVDLSGAGLRFHMRPIGSRVLKVDAVAAGVVLADGTWSYTFVVADTDTEGIFLGELEVTFGGGAVQTFPSNKYIVIAITGAVA